MLMKQNYTKLAYSDNSLALSPNFVHYYSSKLPLKWMNFIWLFFVIFTAQAFLPFIGIFIKKVVKVVDKIVDAIGGDKPMTYNKMTPRMNKDLMFQTDTSVYQKLSSSKYRGFEYWHLKCKGEFNVNSVIQLFKFSYWNSVKFQKNRFMYESLFIIFRPRRRMGASHHQFLWGIDLHHGSSGKTWRERQEGFLARWNV